MNSNMTQKDGTAEHLIRHYQMYPKLRTEDIFKYIFQSSFGCEHLVSDESDVLGYIRREYETVSKDEPPMTEQLDGSYCRVGLSCLNNGLKAETLAKLFCLSAKNEPEGKALLARKIQVVKSLVDDGVIPLDRECFNKKLEAWRNTGFSPVHHSDEFRSEYQPAYRLVANKYADFLQLFTEIDKLSGRDCVLVAIDGSSASGKTTLAGILKEVYGCSVFHMDDFFLQPHQRTSSRLMEVGGNVDRERFLPEVLKPLSEYKTVTYRRFDCTSQALCSPTTVYPNKLAVIEGAYSMHPTLAPYYDFSVFLDIDGEYQKERIRKRNSPRFAERFFNEWIPMEQEYFSEMKVRERCSLCIKVVKHDFR